MTKALENITSLTNSKVKLAMSLHQKKYRDKQKLFLLEGLRNAEMAQEVHAKIKMCFCTEKILSNNRAEKLIEKLTCPMYLVPDNIYAKLSDTDSPQGLMLIIEQDLLSLDELQIKEHMFLLALDRLQDPGNIGTIIRTADAMGVDGIICLNGTADIFSPKVVRSAMGSLFNLPIYTKINETNLLEFAKQNQFKLYATALNEQAKASWNVDYQEKCIIVLGNEANGVSNTILNHANEQIYIPMQGKAESLNVANACAMIIYEKVRSLRLDKINHLI